MSRLRLALLGAPEVCHAGQVLAFRTRKTLALLIYLAVEGGHHSREKLTALFWPESDEEHGRTMLRRTLLFLRQALGESTEIADTRRAAEPPQHLIVERHALGFNAAADCDLDLHTLQVAIGLTKAPELTRPRLLAQLQAAVDSYRGDFLEGFSLLDAPDFENWASIQREAWHRRMDHIFDQLARLQADGGEIASAIESTSRWVAHDPLNEAAHQRLVELHFAAGSRAAALQAYETCRAILATELQLEPTPETEALAQRFRSHAPPRRERTFKPLTSLTRPTLPEAPFIGRATEFARLIAIYRAIQHGSTQLVVLEGEAGIGKTRLTTEFLGWAAAQGVEVLQGCAFEAGGRLPYQPLIDALRDRLAYEHALDGRTHESIRLSPVWLAELSRLLPELRDRYPDLPSPTLDEVAARGRLFEAVTQLGQALAVQTPLVCFIDDVHSADAASLDLLHYAARRWGAGGLPVLLLLTVRSEALHPHATSRIPDVAAWLASLGRDLIVTRLTVGPLTAEDTGRLVRALAGATTDVRRATPVEVFSQWLFRETRGHPFFITETLKALLEQGALTLQCGADGVWRFDFETAPPNEATLRGFLPPGVREVLRSRLARLSEAATRLLAAAAILGHGFSFERMCQVASLGEDAALTALDEALRSHLLQEIAGEEAGAAVGVYGFTHDKIRDVVYTEAGDARRRIFHRRAFEVLQVAAAPPASLAHHAQAAGLSEPAFRFSLAAGDAAMQLFAVRDAIVQYERAWQLAAEPGLALSGANQSELRPPAGGPGADRYHLYVQLGRAYELENAFDRARTVYQALLTDARATMTLAMECVALNRLATVAAHGTHDLHTAAAFLHEAQSIAEQSGDTAGLAETEWNLAQLAVHASDPVSALAHGTRALHYARALGGPDLIARSLNVIAMTEGTLARWAEAEAHAEEARLLYMTLGNRAMEADCLCVIANAATNCGRPHEGIRAARAAATISREIENVWGQVNSAIHLTIGLLEIGDYSEALAVAAHGVTLARAHELWPGMRVLSLATLGTVQRALFALDTARAMHAEALALNQATASRPPQMFAAELCADDALAEAWEQAYAYAQQARTPGASPWFYLYMGLRLSYQTEALVRGGADAQALADVQRFGACIGNNRRYQIPYRWALAVLAQASGTRDQAITQLQEAAAAAEAIGLPGEHWQIQAALGELHRAGGDQERAWGAFAQAAAIVHAIANRIDDTALQATFLTAQPIRRVLARANG